MKKHIVRDIIRCINGIIPKNKKKIIFQSFPDFSDNARAVYEYMQERDEYAVFKYVWVVEHPDNMSPRKSTIYVKESPYISFSFFRYLFHMITAKFLIATHNSFYLANRNVQTCLCLWHGTGLKTSGALNEREKVGFEPCTQYSFYGCSSSFYADVFDKTFLCGKDRVKVTGYPRNDFLFEDTNILDKLGIIKNDDEKIIVYMPTFRKPKGCDYNDGEEGFHEQVFNFDDNDFIEQLNRKLESCKVKMVLKWHPSDVRQYNVNHGGFLISVDNNKLAKEHLIFYHLLHFADALITDYSSVFTDFMMLDRPLAFDVSDMDSYGEHRGFVFSNPLDYMPGSLIREKEDLFSFINDVGSGIDRERKKRHELYPVFNDYQDRYSTSRVLKAAKIQ